MLKGCTGQNMPHVGACYTNKSKTDVENESDRERERDTYLETLSPLQKPHLNACIDSFKICTTVQILLYDMDIYPKQKCKPMQYT